MTASRVEKVAVLGKATVSRPTPEGIRAVFEVVVVDLVELFSALVEAGSGLRGGAGRVFNGGESDDERDGGHQYGRESAQGSGGGRFRSDAGGGFGGKGGGNGGLLNGIDGTKGAFGNPQNGGIDENGKGGFHNDEGDAITVGGG